jgi:hypothetical protein
MLCAVWGGAGRGGAVRGVAWCGVVWRGGAVRGVVMCGEAGVCVKTVIVSRSIVKINIFVFTHTQTHTFLLHSQVPVCAAKLMKRLHQGKGVLNR